MEDRRDPDRPFWTEADVIHSYTRADMVRDGSLVEVEEKRVVEVGLTFPTALTQACYEDCVKWGDEERERSRVRFQDEGGRLHDVLWMALVGLMAFRKRAGRLPTAGEPVVFTVLRRPRPGRGRKMRVALQIVAGIGDDGRPCWTIATAAEDWT